MSSNSILSTENDHAIWEVNKYQLASLQQKISQPPQLLSKTAGGTTCCIFRVPQRLVDINGQRYQPHIVSIGPYHHGQPHLNLVQEHKWRFLGTLLDRMQQTKGLSLEDLLKGIQPLEKRARECYSEILHFTSDEFIEIMVLDGCFVVEYFRKISKLVPCEPDDPLFSMSWVRPFLLRDFLRLENQIPFFILQRLFDLTNMPNGEDIGPSLANLTMKFFSLAFQLHDEVVIEHENLEGKHLLDFLRSSFIPPNHERPKHEDKPPTGRVIHCISKLRRAGIKLKVVKAKSFLEVKFSHGVIEMPSVTFNDFTSSFLLNCVAYEHCHGSCSKHMTTYATLLDCLVNTSKDVEYLCEGKIFEVSYGTDSEVAKFINDMRKDVVFDINGCYLETLFNDVNEHYRKNRHRTWASFMHTYFDTPWSFISAFAALILLLLTVTQTYFTVLAYVRPRREI